MVIKGAIYQTYNMDNYCNALEISLHLDKKWAFRQIIKQFFCNAWAILRKMNFFVKFFLEPEIFETAPTRYIDSLQN